MKLSTPLVRSARPLAAAALVGALLAGCGTDDETEPTASDTADTPTASTSPTDDTSPSAPAESDGTDEGGASVTVPVYFAGQTPQGLRLYREFRSVGDSDPSLAALELLTSGDPLDPDYSSPVSGLDVQSVSAGDGSIDVTLAGTVPEEAGGLNRAQAKVAVQSVVYTLQGVAQSRDPIRFTSGSGSVSTLFGIDVSTPVKAADPVSVLSLVNVTSPEQGQTVSGSFTASGVASSFEGNVPWQIRDAGGDVVLDGFATADGYLMKLYPWQTDIDVSGLEAGAYTFVATTASTGEGPAPFEDTKTFTVE